MRTVLLHWSVMHYIICLSYLCSSVHGCHPYAIDSVDSNPFYLYSNFEFESNINVTSIGWSAHRHNRLTRVMIIHESTETNASNERRIQQFFLLFALFYGNVSQLCVGRQGSELKGNDVDISYRVLSVISSLGERLWRGCERAQGVEKSRKWFLLLRLQ